MTFVNKRTPDDEFDNVHRLVMSDLTKDMSSKIIVGNVGAVAINDTNIEGYYLVQFDSIPYPLQEDTTLDGIELHVGAIVCNAQYLYPAKKKSQWYLKSKKQSESNVIAFRQLFNVM